MYNFSPRIQNDISKSEKSELIKPTRTYVQSSSSSSARTITRTYEPLSIFNLKSLQLNTTVVDMKIDTKYSDTKYLDEKCSDKKYTDNCINNSHQSTSHNECGDDSGSNEVKQSETSTTTTRNSANTSHDHGKDSDRMDFNKTVRSNCINKTNVTKNNTTGRNTTHYSENNKRNNSENKEGNGGEINERNEIIEEEDDDRQLTAQEYEAIANKVMSSHTFTASCFFLSFLLCLPTAIILSFHSIPHQRFHFFTHHITNF